VEHQHVVPALAQQLQPFQRPRGSASRSETSTIMPRRGSALGRLRKIAYMSVLSRGRLTDSDSMIDRM
jgi:hypothetical protein